MTIEFFVMQKRLAALVNGKPLDGITVLEEAEAILHRNANGTIIVCCSNDEQPAFMAELVSVLTALVVPCVQSGWLLIVK